MHPWASRSPPRSIVAPPDAARSVTAAAAVVSAVAAVATEVAPVFLLLYTLDCLNMVIVGALRGAGQQLVAMKLSLVQAYAISIPVAICLGFYTPLGLFGLWMGLGCGVAAAVVGGAWFLSARFSWQLAAQVARKRSGHCVIYS